GQAGGSLLGLLGDSRFILTVGRARRFTGGRSGAGLVRCVAGLVAGGQQPEHGQEKQGMAKTGHGRSCSDLEGGRLFEPVCRQRFRTLHDSQCRAACLASSRLHYLQLTTWREQGMDWRGRRQSSNIEDRRGQPLSAGAGGGGLILLLLRILPWLLRTRLGRIVLAVGVVAFFGARMLGIDLLQLGGPVPQQTASVSAEAQQLAGFASVVLAATEQTWQRILAEQGQRYEEPVLVLFSQRVASACGTASSAVGPFYCPADRKVYLDLSFFHDLDRQLDAPGDFAQAYVVAHEVGHHLQTLLGISQQVRDAGRGKSAAVVNALSVRQELQADCLAGVWGHSAHRF